MDRLSAYSILLLAGLVWVSCESRPQTVAEQQHQEQERMGDTAQTDAIAPYETDVPYVATPQRVVERMLEMAEVDEDDVVYDLGSGDGRFVITAAQHYGATAVGVEIVPELVRQSRQTASLAGVADQTTFVRADFFEVDVSDATVVVMYLLPEVMAQLKPRLLRQLDPGVRIVAHDYVFAGWPPEASDHIGEHRLYRWTVPETVSDSMLQVPDSLASK